MTVDFNKTSNTIRETDTIDYAPSIEMGIKHAPTKLIVKYLTDMYTSPHEAAIRETVSNALDASIKNGYGYDGVSVHLTGVPYSHNIEFLASDEEGREHKTVIIENIGITPNDWIIVSDRGEGMNENTLMNVYTQYGVSNKRDDDNATGAFGLGAKAPLAYCNELYILTKSSDDMKCRFVTCYRTSDDMLVADTPVIIDSAGDVIHYRNNGNLTPKAEAATKRETLRVHDVFGDKTGTIVMFPIENASRTRVVLRSMATLIYGCNHSKILDCTMKNVKFVEFPETLVADSNGKMITARAYFNNNSYYAHERVTTDLIDWACGQKAPSMLKIGFKIGDWYYPLDSSWIYNQSSEEMPQYANLLIEVPSAALSFVPSRDAILENANSSAIIEAVRATIKELLENPDEFAVFLEKVCNLVNDAHGDKTIINPLHSLATGKYQYRLIGNMLEIVRNDEQCASNKVNKAKKYALNINLEKLHGINDKTFTNMMHDLPSIMFALTYDKNTAGLARRVALNGGPLVSTKSHFIAMILGKTYYEASYLKDNRVIGLAVSGTKTAADKLVIGENHSIQCSSFRSREKYNCTSYIPQSLALTNVDEWANVNLSPSKPKVMDSVIIDASKTKISRVRAALSRIIDQKMGVFSALSGNAICCVIPPRADNQAQHADSQIAELKEMLEAISGNVITIAPDELEKLLERPKTKEVDENSEIRKLVYNASVLTQNGAIRNRVNAWNAITHAQQGKNALMLLKECNKDASREIVNLMRTYELFEDDEFDNIIIVNERNAQISRVEHAISMGLTILYDEVFHMDEALISDNDFRITTDGNNTHNYAYMGEITEKIRNIKRNEIAVHYRSSIVMEFKSLLERPYYSNMRKSSVSCDELGAVMSVVTNGKMQLEKSYFKDYNNDSSIPFVNVTVADASINQELDNVKNMISSFADYVAVWNKCLKSFGIKLQIDGDYMLDSSDYIEFLTNLGKVTGAYDMCEAHQAGIPLNDLFPMR